MTRHFQRFDRARAPIPGLIALLFLMAAPASFADEMGEGAGPQLTWMLGEEGASAPIGDGLAEIDLDGNYLFLDANGTRTLMDLTENPLSGLEMATVSPRSDTESWFIVFEYDDIGYVEDEDKDSLDAESILDSIREGTEAANEVRRENGWGEFHIVGWHEPPHYDTRTNNLSWAIVGESGDGQRSVNRITKLLGRRGVMTATLVASPDELANAIAQTDALLDGYRYQAGNTYAEFEPSTDKIAEIGLAALVVGGAGAALVKSGLLAKLWKPIAGVLLAIGAAIKRFFGSSKHDPQAPIG